MSRLRTAAASGLLAALVLAACGTTDAPTEDNPATEDGTAPEAEALTLTDSNGEEVVLENGPAQRIVALEWAQAEIVTSLGVELVGVSDVSGYDSWVGTAVPLLGEPADVGLRTEPSVEAIADLEPDLILATSRSIPDAVTGQLDSIAPVLVVDTADATDPLAVLADRTELIGQAIGKEAEAQELVAEFEQTLAANAEAIEAADLTGTPVVLTSPYSDGSNVTIRMHGPGSGVQTVAREIGLADAWIEQDDAEFGLSHIDIEGLTALPEETWFLYWANDDSADPIGELTGNAIWDNLAFVQDGRVAGAANGIWAYGGPASLAAWSDDLVAVLTQG